MDLGLTGARALVGGGSGGLGGAIAATLRAEGAAVGLVARPSDRLTAAAARLDALAVPADLSAVDGPAAAVAAGVEAFGGLDLLVVNSGGPPPGRFDDLDDAAWQTAIDGTLWSAIRLLRAALPHLRDGRDPAILVILSSSGARADPGPDDLEPDPAGPRRADQVAGRGDRPGPDQRARAGPPRHGPDRPARRGAVAARRPAGRGDRAPDDRPDPARPLRRSARARAGRRRSCCRRPRRTSPGRSCRSTAG